MASVCMTQNNYPQPQHHFQIINGNMMMLPQQQHQPQQALQQVQYVNKLQPIAPAQQQMPKVLGNSNLQNIQQAPVGGPMMDKKRFTYTSMPYGEQMPSVARRNARERNRVKQVNNGFSNLRQHLPQTVINNLSSGGRGASKKLSKVDTLRIAVEYIRGLQDLLDSADGGQSSSTATSSSAINYDDSSNDGSNYGYSSIGSPVNNQSYHMTHSPTSSYSDSDVSVNAANSFVTPLKLEEPEQEFKFETFEHGDDEELLDYISSWQDQ